MHDPTRDPDFFEDLKAWVLGTSPHDPLPKKLAKKKVSSHLKKSFVLSCAAHAALMISVPVGLWLNAWLGFTSEREARLKASLAMARQAIRVDIVDLPQIKVSDLNKVDLSKDVGDAAPTSDPQAPQSTAMIDQTAAAEKAKTSARLKAETRVKEIQDRLKVERRRNELIEKLKEKRAGADGRQKLAGNIVSEGYSTTGEVATEVDAYNGKAAAHLRGHFNIPAWFEASNLRARVLVKIGPDGRVLSQEFLKRSGNAEFDAYVDRAIQAANPFPAPPENLRRTFLEEGVEWGFPK
jgi:TonB family protein